MGDHRMGNTARGPLECIRFIIYVKYSGFFTLTPYSDRAEAKSSIVKTCFFDGKVRAE
jgi:hypothetical protein